MKNIHPDCVSFLRVSRKNWKWYRAMLSSARHVSLTFITRSDDVGNGLSQTKECTMYPAPFEFLRLTLKNNPLVIGASAGYYFPGI